MNKNIYSRYFTPAERQGLAKLSFDDLSSEIKLFRVLLIRQLAAEKALRHPLTLKDRIATLRAYSHLTTTLGMLTRSQNASHNPMSEFEQAIEQAIKELNQEDMLEGLFPYD